MIIFINNFNNSMLLGQCLKKLTQQGYVGFDILTATVMKSFIFWNITNCSLLKFNQRFGGTCHLHLQGQRISQGFALTLLSCLDYLSTLKIDVTRFSKTLVDFQLTTQCIS
jgi:hypothetical protein